MATATLTGTPRLALKAPKAPDRCGLVLRINGTRYTVRPIPAEDPDVRRAWRLRKLDDSRPVGAVYDVAETTEGNTCDCPDHVFRRDGVDPRGCKHLRALARLGLIAAPTMVP